MYVGISKELRKSIIDHIDRMKEAQLERIVEATQPFTGELGPEWAPIIEAKAWGDPIKLKDQLPSDWLHPHETVDVHFRDTPQDHMYSAQYRGESIDFPPTFDERSAPDVYFEVDELEPEIRAKLLKYWQLIEETSTRYEQTQTEVLKLLDRCKSLNEAVALLPDLRYFLSDSIKARLDAKRKSDSDAEPDRRLEGVDTALITSAMVVEQLHPEKED